MLGRRLSSGGRFRGFPAETVSSLQEIPASPFRVKVDPSHDASKVKAEGPGLSKAGKMAPGGLLRASATDLFGPGTLRDSSPPKAGICRSSAPAQVAGSGRAPAPVADSLGRAGAEEPVRLVVKVKPIQPGLSPHFTVYPSRCGKWETDPLHCLYQRGWKGPTERAVQQPPARRRREGLGHHRQLRLLPHRQIHTHPAGRALPCPPRRPLPSQCCSGCFGCQGCGLCSVVVSTPLWAMAFHACHSEPLWEVLAKGLVGSVRRA